MQRIKRSLKCLQLIIDDKLGNPFIYNYQKNLYKLTLVLIVAIFVVVRGSTAPVLFDSKIMRFLFCSDESGDKTLYNIGISVIAAYIFYFVQVHIPEKTHCKKMMNAVARGNRHQIFILEQFIKAWDVFLDCNEEIYFCHFKEFEYTTNHGAHSLTKDLYKETVDELIDNIERVCSQPKFDECDSAYQEMMATLYGKLYGFRRFLLDILPLWEDAPQELSKSEYMLIKARLREFSRFSKKLQNIEKYAYTIEEKISPYKGKGLIQTLAEEL